MSSASVQVSQRAAARLRAGYPWVFEGDVSHEPAIDADVVTVVDARGGVLGTALHSPHARIRLRMLSKDRISFDDDLIETRLREALERRAPHFCDADAYRVAHAEADLLPGLVVDRYADVAVLQTGTRAMDARKVRIAEIVQHVLGARLVVARDDGSARDLEQLSRESKILVGQGPARVRYHDAGSVVEVDVLADGKTGGFLDQIENHARVQEYARGEALDVCTYHGGFALALRRGGATRVLAIDEKSEHSKRVLSNAALNGYTDVESKTANAFDLLRNLEGQGRSFDTIVVDPPALAKRKSADNVVDRAYKELNFRALRLLRPGGVLFTCSCSGKMTLDRFTSIVEDAARDAGRVVQLLERRGAGRDHPPLLCVPETDYLKGLVLQVVA